MTTPPFAGIWRRISSGTLRGTSQTPRAAACEKITGACVTRRVSAIVSGDECARSTSMPRRFISRTTSSPKAVRPVMARRDLRGRIGPVRVGVVRQCHVAHAELVVGAQRAERVLERVAALHAEQRGDPAIAFRLADLGDAGRQPQCLRVPLDHSPRELDLLELVTRVTATGLARYVHRPELRADAAGAQAFEVRLAAGALAQVVGREVPGRDLVVADRDRQVVVAVDQYRGLQDPVRPGQRWILGRVGGTGERQAGDGRQPWRTRRSHHPHCWPLFCSFSQACSGAK